MDIFNLIRAVRCREPIWNRQHAQYKDRECSLLLWSQVAEETGVDVETARCKWRGLRDTFRVQLRKLNQPVKKGLQNPLTWEYFDEMVFVKDQIYIDVNRKKYCKEALNGKESKLESGEAMDDDEFQVPADFCITEVTEDTETRLQLEPQAAAEDRNSLSDGGDSSWEKPDGETLQKKLRALQDDNYCFLMSILPQLKSLPHKQKLFVRIKIQEMLLTEVLNLEGQE